jgi:hypothetical protein
VRVRWTNDATVHFGGHVFRPGVERDVETLLGANLVRRGVAECVDAAMAVAEVQACGLASPLLDEFVSAGGAPGVPEGFSEHDRALFRQREPRSMAEVVRQVSADAAGRMLRSL